MMAIQCFVMIQKQNYTNLLLISTFSSFFFVSIPAVVLVSAVNDNELESGRLVRNTTSSVCHVTVDIFVWMTDSFIRTIPIIYLLVHRFTEGIILMILIMVMSTMYIVYTLDVKCNFLNEHGIVMGWTLTFSSVYKLILRVIPRVLVSCEKASILSD